MLEYLLKSSACMAVFLLFYQFLLERENMHQFKRFFLLGALLLSLIIPALVFTEYVDAAPQSYSSLANNSVEEGMMMLEEPPSDMDVINWSLLLWTFYGLGLFAFGLRFSKHLYQILLRIRKNPKLKGSFMTKVLLQAKMPPHTFFSYIFLNQGEFEKGDIPNEVLLHEETHAKQYHTIDVLLIELLQVVMWFNPLLLLFKKHIKLNHEFLADNAVIKKNKDPKKYQNTLLSYLSSDSAQKYQSVTMANAINYSSIKKRFTIMKKETSKSRILIRTVLIVPLCALLFYGFSSKKIVERVVDPPISSLSILQEEASQDQMEEYKTLAEKYSGVGLIVKKKDVERMNYLYGLMSNQQKETILPFNPNSEYLNLQKGASREQMKEYNALAKKYNEMPKGNMRILMKEVERMEYIYGLMSDKQRADAEPFPNIPEPPQPPNPPQPQDIREVPPSSPTSATTEVREVPPPPVIGGDIREVPPPPPPITPLDHIVKMAKKGATFYYEGKKVSSDKAIELLKKNKNLNIETTRTNSKSPQVKISKEPTTMGKNKSGASLETGNMKANGREFFYSKKDGVTSYFDSQGRQVDELGQPLRDASRRKPTYYFNGEQISSVKAHELLRNNTSIQVVTEDITEKEYAIVLKDLNADSGHNFNKNTNHNALIDLTEMISMGASFYYNDEPISTEKALWLTQNEQIERVQTVGSKNGKPKVFFWKKV